MELPCPTTTDPSALTDTASLDDCVSVPLDDTLAPMSVKDTCALVAWATISDADTATHRIPHRTKCMCARPRVILDNPPQSCSNPPEFFMAAM